MLAGFPPFFFWHIQSVYVISGIIIIIIIIKFSALFSLGKVVNICIIFSSVYFAFYFLIHIDSIRLRRCAVQQRTTFYISYNLRLLRLPYFFKIYQQFFVFICFIVFFINVFICWQWNINLKTFFFNRTLSMHHVHCSLFFKISLDFKVANN